jgi:hypothetical protein
MARAGMSLIFQKYNMACKQNILVEGRVKNTLTLCTDKQTGTYSSQSVRFHLGWDFS